MSRPPNILFITSDQQHWNTIGKHFAEVHTPNLDRLADRGMLVRRAYCPNPTCTPTRSSIITGLQPSRHGAWSLGTKLPESVPTLGDHLQAVGYDCALIGKAHLQPLVSQPEHPSIESYPRLRDLESWRDFHGPFYGFNHVDLARHHADETHVGQHYGLWCEEQGFISWRDHYQDRWGTFDFSDGTPNPPQTHTWSLPAEYHSNEWITQRSITRMNEAHANRQPFFLWASYFDPHPPYVVPKPWDKLYDPTRITVPAGQPDEHVKNPLVLRKTQETAPDFSAFDEAQVGNHGLHTHRQDRASLAQDVATYYGMISFLDAHVGRLLDELDRLGIAEETLVVFTSDHGHYYGHHNLIAKGPFHYEDGIRVPFIACWPGQIAPGVESDALCSLVDLAPTFLNAAGFKTPATMQGVDQLPVWRGESPAARRHVIVEHRAQPTTLYLKTFVTDRHKLTLHLGQPDGELYDLTVDPGEFHNRWHDPEYSELREQLTREMLFAEMTDEPMPMPRIAPA